MTGLDDLLADDAAHLRELHGRVMAAGTPAPAAATYLAGWYGGSLAQLVGTGLAVERAGLILDRSTVSFRIHPDGWPEGVDPGPRPVTVGCSAADIRRVVEALVECCGPLVSACRSLARVGRVGLWNEIGDKLAMALTYQVRTPVTPGMVGVLEAAWSVPGAPWRARPRLAFARSAVLGEVHVAQKGGCCLSYTTPTSGDPLYCAHCPFRTPEECDAAQVAWLEQEHGRAAS
jgi:hypothetical protein